MPERLTEEQIGTYLTDADRYVTGKEYLTVGQESALILLLSRALRQVREEWNAAREQVRMLREELDRWMVAPDYDCPGDTPELSGWICLNCGAGSASKTVVHKPTCALAASEEKEAK